eukprot:CAMPEP_0185744476 /NCGR_PEP_ID=MMETSP1174-20130828/2611_1 /TAXON_ID=35687 /ORGANISM="Dictyocha speculum, Strain CCMP1381" /LENGTH=1046 /DNA_ID=CAMNT_0028417909 /DNA_START=77 /DNA_END=3214 /DNA_ORIENTATION=-
MSHDTAPRAFLARNMVSNGYGFHARFSPAMSRATQHRQAGPLLPANARGFQQSSFTIGSAPPPRQVLLPRGTRRQRISPLPTNSAMDLSCNEQLLISPSVSSPAIHGSPGPLFCVDGFSPRVQSSSSSEQRDRHGNSWYSMYMERTSELETTQRTLRACEQRVATLERSVREQRKRKAPLQVSGGYKYRGEVCIPEDAADSDRAIIQAMIAAALPYCSAEADEVLHGGKKGGKVAKLVKDAFLASWNGRAAEELVDATLDATSSDRYDLVRLMDDHPTVNFACTTHLQRTNRSRRIRESGHFPSQATLSRARDRVQEFCDVFLPVEPIPNVPFSGQFVPEEFMQRALMTKDFQSIRDLVHADESVPLNAKVDGFPLTKYTNGVYLTIVFHDSKICAEFARAPLSPRTCIVVAFYIGKENSVQLHRAFKHWFDMFAKLNNEGTTVKFQTRKQTIDWYHSSGRKDVFMDADDLEEHLVPISFSSTNDLKAVSALAKLETTMKASDSILKGSYKSIIGVELQFPLEIDTASDSFAEESPNVRCYRITQVLEPVQGQLPTYRAVAVLEGDDEDDCAEENEEVFTHAEALLGLENSFESTYSFSASERTNIGGAFGQVNHPCACCCVSEVTKNSIPLYGSCPLCALYGVSESDCIHHLIQTEERRHEIRQRHAALVTSMNEKYEEGYMLKVLPPCRVKADYDNAIEARGESPRGKDLNKLEDQLRLLCPAMELTAACLADDLNELSFSELKTQARDRGMFDGSLNNTKETLIKSLLERAKEEESLRRLEDAMRYPGLIEGCVLGDVKYIAICILHAEQRITERLFQHLLFAHGFRVGYSDKVERMRDAVHFLQNVMNISSFNVTLNDDASASCPINDITGLTREKCSVALKAGLKPEEFNVPNVESVEHPLVSKLISDDDPDIKKNINMVVVLWLQIFHLLRSKGDVERGAEGWKSQNEAIAKKLGAMSSQLWSCLMKIPHGKHIAHGNYFHYILQGHAEEMILRHGPLVSIANDGSELRQHQDCTYVPRHSQNQGNSGRGSGKTRHDYAW